MSLKRSTFKIPSRRQYNIFFSGSGSTSYQISSPALQATQGYSDQAHGQGEDTTGPRSDRGCSGTDEQGCQGDYLDEGNLAQASREEGSNAERDE